MTTISDTRTTVNQRLVEVTDILRRKLFEFVEEAGVTEQEYIGALLWLNRVGAADEAILLADVLHLSAHVVDVNNDEPAATPSTVLGPFYFPERQREVPNPGTIVNREPANPFVLSGVVTDLEGNPLTGVMLDFWQSDEEGFYDNQHGDEIDLRGRMLTDDNGRYEVHSSRPMDYPVPTDGPVGEFIRATGRNPMRPAHFHVFAQAPGFKPKITHIFPHDSEYLDNDAVNGVKEALIYEFTRGADGVSRATFDIALAPA
jgi:hydroxyquinol 1,2-dioxygenase